jgi:L-amino acid N-acyltransferase YncA
MITYQVERFSSFMEDFKKIIPEHYEELSVTKQYALEPNWDQYLALEAAGLSKVITVRDDTNLIGYMIFFVQPHLHYKSCLTAFEDIYYLKKDYRKGRTGIKMFQYAEEYLKSLGVNRIMSSTKLHMDNSKLLEYLGYSFFEKLYSKLI